MKPATGTVLCFTTNEHIAEIMDKHIKSITLRDCNVVHFAWSRGRPPKVSTNEHIAEVLEVIDKHIKSITLRDCNVVHFAWYGGPPPKVSCVAHL